MSRRSGMLVMMTLALVGALVAPASGQPRYHVDATLDPETRTIAGTIDITIENRGRAPLDDVVLVLYPNRFQRPDPGIDDFNRPYVYPREEFVAGGMTIDGLELRRDDGGATSSPSGLPPTPVADIHAETVDDWADTALRARLPRPLPPGEKATLHASFRTVLPERYGPFGVADGVVALGGWHPLLAGRDPSGAWQLAPDPSTAVIEGVVRVPRGMTVVRGQQIDTAEDSPLFFNGRLIGADDLIAEQRYRLHERRVADATTVRYLELPARFAHMTPPWRTPHATVVLDSIERILRQRPPGVPLPPRPLVVAEVPLRLELTAPSGDGLVIVSDRMLRTDPVLRDFHERALATSVYAALLRAPIAARERAADAPWITEGVAATLADRYLAAVRPQARTVYDWIRLFNVFAIVDRFESAPKVPFAQTFFPEARHASELRDGVESFARDRPPGRTIFAKLRNEIGEATFAATIDAYLAGDAPFHIVAAERAGHPLDWLFDQWTAPYPGRLDYAIGDDTRMNESMDTATGGGPAFQHRVVVDRTASRPIREPVDIEVRGWDDQRVHLVWDDAASRAEFVVTTPWRARRVTLDPERRLLEDTRIDDAKPRPLQVVLDSADVTVTSSEFGLSGLFVARQRYDYRKDLGLVAFYSDRGVGFSVGPRVHFGPPNDATSYRHNIYGFYTFAGLSRSFTDHSRPAFRTDGQLGGVGLRYDYTDEFTYDNPTHATKLRAFADLYDRDLGSAFDYADWGVRASAVRPLLTPRTLLAGQLMTAFSTPTGSGHVPNQGRYSLGGDLAIRGIRVDERLGENLALARVELRQMLYPELDLSLADVLVLRHVQLRLFADTGNVQDRRASLFRLSDFAVGVGIGVAAYYDFLGFYPAAAYVAIAARVDHFAGVDNGVQFLFGTRQAF